MQIKLHYLLTATLHEPGGCLLVALSQGIIYLPDQLVRVSASTASVWSQSEPLN